MLKYVILYASIGAAGAWFSEKNNYVPLAVAAAIALFIGLSWPKYLVLTAIEFAVGAGLALAIKHSKGEL